MAAPNQQPCGSRPAPKAPNEHAPHSGGKSSTGGSTPTKGPGVAGHGTPKPVGKGKGNPLR